MRRIITALLVCLPVSAQAGWKEDVIAAAKAEPKVSAAEWTTARTLSVEVADDGSRRDGYAQYVCILMNENGKPAEGSFRAKVVDRKTGRDLGEAVCSN